MSLREEKKAVVKRFYDGVVNGRDLTVIDEVEVHEFMDHRFPPAQGYGAAATHRVYSGFIANNPGGRSEANLFLCEGDFVLYFCSGHTPHAASGKMVIWDIMDLFHVVDGRMVEKWGVTDIYHRLQQMGQLPPEGMRPVKRPVIPFSERGVTEEVMQRNKAVVWRFFNGVINGKNLGIIDETVSAQVVDHYHDPDAAIGIAGTKRKYERYLGAFSDVWAKSNCLVAEGNLVGLFQTATGVHDKGEFLGVKATGKTLTMQSMHLFRLEEGKIAERWSILDRMAVLRQMGALPQGL